MVKLIGVLSMKEIKSFLTSPLIYLVAALFNGIMGWLFFNYLVMAKEDPTKPLQDVIFSPFFGSLNFVLLFFIPILTMRSIAEEKKEGTLDLLFQSQLKGWSILVGKFLAIFAVLFLMIGTTLFFPLIVNFTNEIPWGIVLFSYLGILLAVSLYVWIGIFASTLTENQFVAALISFVILFLLMLLVLAGNLSGNEFVMAILAYLAPGIHLGPFSYGFIKSYSVVYYLSANLFFFYLSDCALRLKRV